MAAESDSMGLSLTGKIRERINYNQEHGDHSGDFGAYGEPVSSYRRSFSPFLGEALKVLKDKPSLTVVDLMAPSDTVVSLFKMFPNKQKFGVAVSLEDLRKSEAKERDAKSNVVQVAGDILKSSTWDKIEEQLQGRKADLIMERALAGLSGIPNDEKVFAMLMNRAWGLLSRDNGIFIFKIQFGFEAEAEKMIDIFRKNGINVRLRKPPKKSYVIKLVKDSNSPEKLPFPTE